MCNECECEHGVGFEVGGCLDCRAESDAYWFAKGYHRCEATTKKGGNCRHLVEPDKDHCPIHS